MRKQMMKQIWNMMTLILLLPLAAFGEAPANAKIIDEIPPPPKIQEGEALGEPQVTIRKKGNDTIEEYRMHGQLYMIKVTPAHGVPYYLHRADKGAKWVNIGPNPPLSVPKWILFRF